MSYIVVAYYTKDQLYTDHANRLIASLKQFDVPYDVQPVDSLGDWYKNTQFKPLFLKQMMAKHSGVNLVYVDVDAVFLAKPVLFDTIDADPSVNIAAHLLNHTKYRCKTKDPELLSGTLYLRNNGFIADLIDKWMEKCKVHPLMWDQAALSQVVGTNFYHLPDGYCCIFDYMVSEPNKVIVHYQASRKGKQLFPLK